MSNKTNPRRIRTVNDLLGHLHQSLQTAPEPEHKQKNSVMKTKKILPTEKFLRAVPINRSSYPLLLSHDSFCDLFEITKETCAEWRKNYEIPYVNLPHRIFFRVEDVQDFIDSLTVIKKRQSAEA